MYRNPVVLFRATSSREAASRHKLWSGQSQTRPTDIEYMILLNMPYHLICEVVDRPGVDSPTTLQRTVHQGEDKSQRDRSMAK